MATATLTVSDDVKEELNKFSWINWSEVAREAFLERLRRDKAFDKVKQIVSKSKFTEKDALELGRKINRSLHKRYEEMFKGG